MGGKAEDGRGLRRGACTMHPGRSHDPGRHGHRSRAPQAGVPGTCRRRSEHYTLAMSPQVPGCKAGVVPEFPVPLGSTPFGVAAGPDRALWFTEELGNMSRAHHHRGRCHHEFPVQPAGAYPSASRLISALPFAPIRGGRRCDAVSDMVNLPRAKDAARGEYRSRSHRFHPPWMVNFGGDPYSPCPPVIQRSAGWSEFRDAPGPVLHRLHRTSFCWRLQKSRLVNEAGLVSRSTHPIVNDSSHMSAIPPCCDEDYGTFVRRGTQ
jgi:hypothetical protein